MSVSLLVEDRELRKGRLVHPTCPTWFDQPPNNSQLVSLLLRMSLVAFATRHVAGINT